MCCMMFLLLDVPSCQLDRSWAEVHMCLSVRCPRRPSFRALMHIEVTVGWRRPRKVAACALSLVWDTYMLCH
ncbi:hypothetical protein BD309DRAFT_945508 [Dichomitus squalens]|nr:hypothetical protein BD309DRAFT_945508 [Dichomitus squalens]